MNIEIPNIVAAMGALTGATGAEIFAAGATTARTAKGVYTITLDGNGLDATECSVYCSPSGAQVEYEVTHTSDTVKTVTCIDNAGAAADPTRLDFIVFQAPNLS